MKFFSDVFIKPYLRGNGYTRICEIGSSHGENIDSLIEIDSLSIDIIDPCLDADLCEKYRDVERVSVHKGVSLAVLPTIVKQFDCVLIDGDHNWYTVYHELKTIEDRGLLRPGGSILLHDVGWPYGRRDMYYQPEIIPKDYMHPYKREGIVRGQSELSSDVAFNAVLCNAIYEGGPRNGVATAVEDFIDANKERYRYFHFDDQYGLGVLIKTSDCHPFSFDVTVNVLQKLMRTLCHFDEQLRQRDEQLRQRDEQLRQRDEQLRQRDEQLRQRDEQLQAYHESISWRLTAPLRSVSAIVRPKT